MERAAGGVKLLQLAEEATTFNGIQSCHSSEASILTETFFWKNNLILHKAKSSVLLFVIT